VFNENQLQLLAGLVLDFVIRHEQRDKRNVFIEYFIKQPRGRVLPNVHTNGGDSRKTFVKRV